MFTSFVGLYIVFTLLVSFTLLHKCLRQKNYLKSKTLKQSKNFLFSTFTTCNNYNIQDITTLFSSISLGKYFSHKHTMVLINSHTLTYICRCTSIHIYVYVYLKHQLDALIKTKSILNTLL